MKENNITFIECDLMLSAKQRVLVRENILRQMKEGVVVLPAGFKLVSVDISLLEQIKEEIKDLEKTFYIESSVYDIIDRHIAELKGGER